MLCPLRNLGAILSKTRGSLSRTSPVANILPLTITPSLIPPVDYEPRLRSLAQKHHVTSYWFWHCLTTATKPGLMSLVPWTHRRCYQLRPYPIHYQGLMEVPWTLDPNRCIGPAANPNWFQISISSDFFLIAALRVEPFGMSFFFFFK